MAYRTDISTKDRGGAIVLVIAIHAALLFIFLHLSGKIDLPDPQRAMTLFDFTRKPPPQKQQVQVRSKAKLREGGAAPKNIRSKATDIVAPKPLIVAPAVQQIRATATPRKGAAPTEGNSDVRGPGTGAGGQGSGSGSGSGGSGGGGGNEVAEPPHLVTPVLSGRDFARDLFEQWPEGATVFLRLRVDAKGYVSECMVDRGTGVRAIDATMCNLAHERLRFRPALNRSGQAVAGWFGYAQPAPR